MPGRKWSEDEIETLMKMYPSHSSLELSNLLQRSRASIIWKANALGLIGKRAKQWSKEEIDKLIELYPRHTNREVAALFGRTRNSVEIKARNLGLTKDFEHMIKKKEESRKHLAKYRGKIWSIEEKERFRQLYKVKSNEELAHLFKVSIGAIEALARRLGIHKEHQARMYRQGLEGEKIAEEFFAAKGWKIIEKGESRGRGVGSVAFDFIVETENGERIAIDVKHGKHAILDARTLKNLMTLQYPQAVLFITLDKQFFFMPITILAR